MTNFTGLLCDQEMRDYISTAERIGGGTGREVYEGPTGYVVKQISGRSNMPNFVEWLVWNALVDMKEDRGTNKPNADLHKLFAKCLGISSSGEFLVMERLNTIFSDDDKKRLLSHVPCLPHWLNDKKPSAFGLDAEGNFKVLDYGMINMYDVLNPLNWKTTAYDL